MKNNLRAYASCYKSLKTLWGNTNQIKDRQIRRIARKAVNQGLNKAGHDLYNEIVRVEKWLGR